MIQKCEGPIVGVIQIVHGMMEHRGVYQDAMTRFLGQGYAVHAIDHLGHGTRAAERLGDVPDESAWEHWISDIHHLNDQIHEVYPGVPVFVFGHSMGSYLAQDFAIRYPKGVDGLILSASSMESPKVLWLGYALARFLGWIFGASSSGWLFYKIIFGAFNRPFSPSKTPFDWLTRDDAYLQNYIQDPLCTFVPPIRFYQAFFKGAARFFGSQPWDRLYRRIPLLFVSGDQDPLGKNGVSIGDLISKYRHTGHQVTACLYPGGRHVMLAELNKEDVYRDILNWMSVQRSKG